MKKIFVLLEFCIGLSVSAQTLDDAKNPPKPNEKIIEVMYDYRSGGETPGQYCADRNYINCWLVIHNGKNGSEYNYNEEELYKEMYDDAIKIYKKDYPLFYLRSFTWNVKSGITKGEYDRLINEYRPKTFAYISSDYYCEKYHKYRIYLMSATVVTVDQDSYLKEAVDKTLKNVNLGSRLAIDQLSGFKEDEIDNTKDELLDILLDKGYKVVAKEYLQKLYEEQQQQQSGVYNVETTAQANNFSAAGYYLNVKKTEKSIRVQVINVSTGEYEGNATVNF